MIADLARIVGRDHAVLGTPRPYGEDATRDTLGLVGSAAAVVRPGAVEEVCRVVTWCYEHDVPIVPRGGGTGFAGGAVPTHGGVVLSLERMNAIRALEPACWRAHVEAGVTTATLARRARESGLLFPPNPGAAEQSHIGGNLATNAGGPRAFKYGVMRRWVTGLEVVVAPGEVLRAGGPIRKDVTGYDLVGLFTGSEGTLGIVTAAWLTLLPAPEQVAVAIAGFGSAADGCSAIGDVLGAGITPSAVEYVDGGALAASRAAFPSTLSADAEFVVIVEVDGAADEVDRLLGELGEALASGATDMVMVRDAAGMGAVQRWRDGVSAAVTGVRGGKVSDDVVVPVDRLADMLETVGELGERHGLPTCSWGHAGDGNLHVSFLLRDHAGREREAAANASRELHVAAVALGGSISGEHGIGHVKRGELGLQLGETGARVHASIKTALDPKGLFNPGKKV